MNEQNESNANNLINGTACLVLHFSRPGVTKKLSKEQYSARDADLDLVGAQKKIIDSPEYGKVASMERAIKAFLKAQSLPSKLYRNATFLIPLSRMKAVDTFLEDARPQWKAAVEEYIKTYDARFDETKNRLGMIANEADRMTPEQIRDAFGFDYEYVTLSTPSSLKQISAAMFEREEQRLRTRLESAEADIVAAFRAQFLGLVEGMKAMLAGENNEKGKPLRFKGTRIEKLQAFIEGFKNEQNVLGDSALTKLMDEASKMLAGVNPKELKNDEGWRKATSARFDEIAKTLAGMTVVRGKRLIEVDEPEAAQ